MCKMLSEIYPLYHISVGDSLRLYASKEWQGRNEEVVDCVQHGRLVPTDLLADILDTVVKNRNMMGITAFLIDGFPRRLVQAEPIEALVLSGFSLYLKKEF